MLYVEKRLWWLIATAARILEEQMIDGTLKRELRG